MKNTYHCKLKSNIENLYKQHLIKGIHYLLFERMNFKDFNKIPSTIQAECMEMFNETVS